MKEQSNSPQPTSIFQIQTCTMDVVIMGIKRHQREDPQHGTVGHTYISHNIFIHKQWSHVQFLKKFIDFLVFWCSSNFLGVTELYGLGRV